ncbi:CU044_5270 family protein [Dactylosporangium aurantiacum]|nr:CU044_5270 family protein [Dactylosporangium aurantiacum]MDG6102140.1 CU044_5270 family protein [Dactylosporangium aurantiacum]
MRQLREFRGELPELSGPALTEAERSFVTMLRQERPAPGRRTSRRPLLAAAGLATAAAGVAVAVLLSTGTTPGGAPTTTTGRTAPGSAPGSASAAAPTLRPVSVAEVLDLAAAAPGALTPAPGQFVVTESLVSDVAELGAGGRYLYRMKRTTWSSSDNSRPGAVRTEQLAPRPYPGEPVPADAPAGGTVEVRVLCPVKGGAARQDYAFNATLPTDAQGMLAYFARFPGGGADKNSYLWKAGTELAAAPMPQAQRAAVFQALKRIPGAQLVGDVTDAAGRPGTAVGYRDARDGSRRDLIFDPVTFAYLGSRTVTAGGAEVAASAQLSVTVAADAPAAALAPKQQACA